MRMNKNQSSKIQAAVIEAVEQRQMFAVTAILAAGVLTITGTSAADNITVSKDVANLKVKKDATHTSTFAYASVTKIVANLGGGSDTFTSDNAVGIKMIIHGDANNDTITAGSGVDTIYGDAGNDRINGKDNNDILRGGTGNDTINGNGGADTIYDEAGADNYFGGLGNDNFYVDLVNTTESDLFDGQEGASDYISYMGRSQGVRIQTDGVANDGLGDGTHGAGIERDNVFNTVEILVGTNYADGIYAQGNVANSIWGYGGGDYITAGPGNDTVRGGNDNDWIYGEDGNDSLLGEGGNDSLDGGNNNDTLNGGAGKDSMYGQSGNDKIYAKDGVWSEIVSGGSGTDWAQVDGIDMPFGSDVYFDVLTSIETKVL